MITYTEIYEVLRKEKYSDQLQKLPKNFLTEVANYFKEKKKITDKDESIFSDTLTKTKKQLDNARSILREIIMLRERKIINLTLVAAKIGISKRDTENMLNHEKELFITITKKIGESEKKLGDLMKGNNNEEKTLKNQLIRFKQDTPEFLDIGNRTIGPFKKGDVANLPKEIMDILIKNNQAVKIDE